MGKYGSNEVFDYKVYGADGLLFEIDTAKSVKITRNMEEGTNYLEVEDALIDSKLLGDILNGRYDNVNLRIVGNSVFRSLTGEDVNVIFKLTVAKMDTSYYCFSFDDGSTTNLLFEFPSKDAYGFPNVEVKVDKED